MKYFRDSDGKRVYTSDHIRVTRRFRYHVSSRYNPRGRIHRQLCVFCPPNEQKSLSQFHHIDYNLPFAGVWVCVSCHRKIEAGTLTIKPRMVHDYTQLVAPILNPKMMQSARKFHSRKRLAPTGTDAPF